MWWRLAQTTSVANLGIGIVAGAAAAAIFEMAAAADRTATAAVAEHLPAARATAGAGCGSDASSRAVAACRFARRTATAHGIISFIYNTALLALTVNIAASAIAT